MSSTKAKRKGRGGGAGAPDWIVTFADLMSILVCFFVLIISFSIQDEHKLQIVAGSMREAFGVRPDTRMAGVIQVNGSPMRDYLRQTTVLPQETRSPLASEQDDLRTQPDSEDRRDGKDSPYEEAHSFASAAESLRQSWREMPEIMEMSDQIILEHVPEGLQIQIVDQDGRTMFPPGSHYPLERTRLVLARMAHSLRELPHRIVITGHTSSDMSDSQTGGNGWKLSADRANAVRSILAAHGVSSDRFAAVTGKADADPLFPQDRFLAANRRIGILLMPEEPPMPPGHQP